MKLHEACGLALRMSGVSMTVEEILDSIEKNHWYSFGRYCDAEEMIRRYMRKVTLNQSEPEVNVYFVEEAGRFRLVVPRFDAVGKDNGVKKITNNEVVMTKEAYEKLIYIASREGLDYIKLQKSIFGN